MSPSNQMNLSSCLHLRKAKSLIARESYRGRKFICRLAFGILQEANCDLDAAGYVGYFCLAAGVNLACNVEVYPLLNLAGLHPHNITWLQRCSPCRASMLSSAWLWQISIDSLYQIYFASL